MSVGELAEKMCVSPVVARRVVLVVVCVALAATVPAALAKRAVLPGGFYRGSLPAGGSIAFAVADNARSINRGLQMTGVRAPCGGGVFVTLFNLVIDRPIRIRGRSFGITRKSGDTTTRIKGRFYNGGVARGNIWVKFGGGCHSNAIKFTARG